MESKDIFLGADERYDVYCVKVAERPHLLDVVAAATTTTTTTSSSSLQEADEEESLLPMVDGCDIPSWRKEKMVDSIPPLLASALHVGLGCPLLRRESQLPVVLPEGVIKASKWKALREKLLHQAVSDVRQMSCQEASEPLVVQGRRNTAGRLCFSSLEEENIPVILHGCTQDWQAWGNWTFEKLVHRFGDIRWRFSDTHGAVMSLATYAKYVSCVDGGVIDDAPLAVYDSQFGEEDSPMKELVKEYVVPPCFSVDLFSFALDNDDDDDDDDETAVASEDENEQQDCFNYNSSEEESQQEDFSSSSSSRRPPWRWILMGPPRSGTGLHIDPLWTNAWVTLLEGTKRWILIPPGRMDSLPPGAGLRDPQVPSVIWFRDYYDQVSKIDGVVEILQRPGETVFVPNGWPHLVLNLDGTVAVTHNYASEFGPFERMWEEVLEQEPDFADRWYRGLLRHRPDLAQRMKRS